jgi:predicted membrane-bound spermidine synthase
MNRAVSLILLCTFFGSGSAALIYQLVWQRYLFNGLGVDIDSVTLIVSTFMLGIGLGGATGGWLADRHPQHRIHWYAGAELMLCVLGLLSPWAMGWFPTLGVWGIPYAVISAFAMLILLIPTAIMGTTLPLLTMEFDQTLANIGVSVGVLYFFNTLGAAFGAWLVPKILFMEWGLHTSAWVAASLNFFCFACACLCTWLARKPIDTTTVVEAA